MLFLCAFMQFIVMMYMKDKDEDEYIGVVAAAKILGINYRTFVKRDRIFDFEKKIVGRRVLFSKNDLEKYRENFDHNTIYE